MSKKPNRNTVISVRLDETTLAAVDLLVEAGLAQSRSEAASQFIGIGVQASEPLILKAAALAEHVRILKQEMLDAVKSKNLDKVQHLLTVDEKLKNAKTDEGLTAVLLAAYYRATDIKELLLQQGAELNFYEAAAVGDTSRVQQLAAASPELVDSYSFDGYTPLGLAAHFGNEGTAAYLLKAGADANLKSKDGKLNNTALHASIAGNHMNLVQLLLEHGSDVDAECEGEFRQGFTPLHVAVHFNRVQMVKLLLDHGANPRIRNAQSLSPADYAVAKGNAEIADMLERYSNP